MTRSSGSPTHVGHYELCGILGEGATSTVHRARHRATGRIVAIKMLRLAAVDDEEARARLRLEARVLGRVRGIHLVDALDAGTLDDGQPFLVLEALEGPSVALHVASGPLTLAACVAIADAVLDALTQVHAAGFVHRDIKPSNVVLHHEGELVIPKLIDLGVCLDARTDGEASPRQTQSGAWVGSPCYMAPEQLDGSTIDARTDVYGVGAMLYECLTGEPPHTGMNAGIVAARVLSEPVAPVGERRPDCPRSLARLVMRSLEKAPGKRFASAAEMREALASVRDALHLPEGSDALVDVEPAAPSEHPVSDAAQTRATARPRRAFVWALAGALMLALLAAWHGGSADGSAQRGIATTDADASPASGTVAHDGPAALDDGVDASTSPVPLVDEHEAHTPSAPSSAHETGSPRPSHL